jgi:hypothetical protein
MLDIFSFYTTLLHFFSFKDAVLMRNINVAHLVAPY